MQRIEKMNSIVSDDMLQRLKIQIDLDQKNVSELENQNSEFASIVESINLDLKVRNIVHFIPNGCSMLQKNIWGK